MSGDPNRMAAQLDARRLRPQKIVAESVRERETLRYYPSLPVKCVRTTDCTPRPSAETSSCDDVILTALAQTAVFQTDTDRALVSLFDSEHQYVVAEATRISRILPSIESHHHAEPLRWCGTAFPRSQGVCESALIGDAVHGQVEGKLPLSKLPVVVSDDLLTDSRFRSKSFCQENTMCRFYASIPIRTRRGINIGVLCVTTENTGKEWTEEQTERLRDISRAIMGHLESQRSKAQYTRNGRKNRGLGSFIEGEATLHAWQLEPGMTEASDDVLLEGSLNNAQQSIMRLREERYDTDGNVVGLDQQQHQHQHQHQRRTRTTPANVKTLSTQRDSRSLPRTYPAKPHVNDEHESTSSGSPDDALSRAANIIREAVQVEGCLFVDATMEGYRSSRQQQTGSSSDNQSSTSSDDSHGNASAEEGCRHCNVLGFSTSANSSIDGDTPAHLASDLPQKFLSRLLRAYPKGKIFNLSDDGFLQSSDSSEEDAGVSAPVSHGGTPPQPGSSGDSESSSLESLKVAKKKSAKQREGSILLKAFPGARCVAFTPVWDPRKGRWHSGGFIYTRNPARSFTEEDELSYLKAFGMLAMAEVLRLGDVQADKAKSDVLGSISHELRSPLHGIMLSAELLGDTDLTVFQGNAAHTIEICSRTLLDTIDHLLDYSKVNNLSSKSSKSKNSVQHRTAPALQQRLRRTSTKNLSCNAKLDRLVEEVVESVYAGYTFQYSPIAVPPTEGIHLEHEQPHPTPTTVQFGPIKQVDVETTHASRDISIILSIEAGLDWSCFAEIGAIRRIVMNLVGNALKYTERGTIKVSLMQEILSINRHRQERAVRFTVEDTGKGIGRDFLDQGLFRPFSQEDSLTPGTGLGLSLVKKIVSQLHGKVSIESEAGVGTTASVLLPLEQAHKSSDGAWLEQDDDRAFEVRVQDLKGLRIKLPLGENHQSSSLVEWQNCVSEICREWLMMETVSGTSSSAAADISLRLHDALPTSYESLQALAKTPNVVICPDAFVAHHAIKSFDAANHGGIFEFVSQPIGPYKLARALLLAYTRWMNMSVQPPQNSPSSQTSGEATKPPQDGTKSQTTLSSIAALGSSLNITPARPSPGPVNTGATSSSSSSSSSNLSSSRLSRTHNNPSPIDVRGQSTSPEASDDSTSLFSSSNNTSSSNVLTPETSPTSELSDPLTKILLVDDNHINLKVLSTYLAKLGLGFDVATNGKEAVDLFGKPDGRYSCVFMDISMPVMDGFEATTRIRSHEKKHGLGHVPIIGLSGLASEDAHRDAIGSGMDLLVTKPVKLKALGGLLESVGV